MAKSIKHKIDINYSLKEIHLAEFKVNESESVDLTGETGLKYDFSGEVNLNENDSSIEVMVGYIFFAEEKEIFRLKVKNLFKLHRLPLAGIIKVYQNQHFIKHLVIISVHHLRGIQSIVLKDSKYRELYIPLNVDLGLLKTRESPGTESLNPQNVS